MERRVIHERNCELMFRFSSMWKLQDDTGKFNRFSVESINIICVIL